MLSPMSYFPCLNKFVIYNIFPLAAETFGGWHRVGEREVKKLGSALARHTGQEESEAVHHLWGRLAILLQRGNAAILGNRVPNFPLPQVDGLH